MYPKTIANPALLSADVTTNDLLYDKHILLRKRQKNYIVVTAK